jgi:hypothetical protein
MKLDLKLKSILLFLLVSFGTFAQTYTVLSPDKNLKVSVFLNDKKPVYTVDYKGKPMLDVSPLGLTTNEGQFTYDLSFVEHTTSSVAKSYKNPKLKVSDITYDANQLVCTFENADKKRISVVFQVSNDNIAFKYDLPSWKDRMSCVVQSEATGYKFPKETTTFLSPMMTPMRGFARTTPSYESGYEVDAPLGKASNNKFGFVFPGLFKVGGNGWILLSETGVSSLYCASHLSDPEDGIYKVAYPDPKENNGFGSTGAAISLPGSTPWRTITLGSDLKPIVETTIPYDVVEPLYAPSQDYRFGKSTWSWIVWQDQSMNYQDQKTYIDLAASLKYEYILMDALWDTNIGKERMNELVKYAASKNVEVFLWYNSNGSFNDAPQGPRNKMSTSIERKKEMKWLKETGVKGLKVDFFGGDKQETMRLYEDILSDANDYGLMIIFHGCTLPRGWEVMYPNFVGAEAVVASENLVFSQYARENEAFLATINPFIRNTVAGMEFGGTLLNKYLVRSNEGRNKRLTTDAFQLATAVLFQNPVQMFALTPNNLNDVPAFEIDFMKNVPTTWNETRHIDGYPGKYSVIARRNKENWYVAGVSAEKEAKVVKLKLPMLAGKKLKLYADNDKLETFMRDITIPQSGEVEVTIQPSGGFIIK